MLENKKIKIVIIGIVILLLLIALGKSRFTSNDILEENNAPIADSQVTKTILEINGARYEDTISGEISVYDFMEKLRSEDKMDFKDKTYVGMGKLIEEINGVKNDGKKYWTYSVNGKEAEVGVSNYKIKSGDIVSWKYGTGSY